jgi:hypothetical protein
VLAVAGDLPQLVLAAVGPFGWAIQDRWTVDLPAGAERYVAPATAWDGTAATLAVGILATAAAALLLRALTDDWRPARYAGLAGAALLLPVLAVAVGRTARAGHLRRRAAGRRRDRADRHARPPGRPRGGLLGHRPLPGLGGRERGHHAGRAAAGRRRRHRCRAPRVTPARAPASAPRAVALVGLDVAAVARAAGAPSRGPPSWSSWRLCSSLQRRPRQHAGSGAQDRIAAEVAAAVVAAVGLRWASSDAGWLAHSLTVAGVGSRRHGPYAPTGATCATRAAALLTLASFVRWSAGGDLPVEAYVAGPALVLLALGELTRRERARAGLPLPSSWVAFRALGSRWRCCRASGVAIGDDGLARPLLLGLAALSRCCGHAAAPAGAAGARCRGARRGHDRADRAVRRRAATLGRRRCGRAHPARASVRRTSVASRRPGACRAASPAWGEAGGVLPAGQAVAHRAVGGTIAR